MSSPKRNRARILTTSGLKKLREQIRSHEAEENAGFKYTLERLGELTGLDPETVKNVLDCKGSDKRTIARCFESFGLTLEDSDHISATQVSAAPSDPGFVGRDEAIADLNALVSRNAKVIVIQARGGVGKTTLARKYLQQEFDAFLEFPIAKETKDIASIEGLIEEKLRQLGEEPGREFLVSLDRLKRKLQAERIGILIDNLEPALDSAGRFIEPHRRYVELLRVLSDPTVKSITLITSRERLREVDITVQHYGLRSLDVKAWKQFFQSRNIIAETPTLAALHNAYGGNAKAMDIVSGVVLEDFSGDVEAYWKANQDDLFIERDLEDLVKKQFDRLQQLDPDAYKLLCRMGCYRYQDVSTLPIEGLFYMLWDVPENRHRRVVKSLQDRSLVDYRDEMFWLHPVIRAEAISRLKDIEDWNYSNCKAAEFWTQTVNIIEDIEDALKALEAYYHYVEADEFNLAIDVLLQDRSNKWQKEERLDTSLYRLGILHKVSSTITELEEGIKSGNSLSGFYHILGDIYAWRGHTAKAIHFFKKSASLAEDFKLELYKVMSFQNIGHCNFDIYEFDEAEKYFEKNITLAGNTSYHRYAVNALFCLAFINSRKACKVSRQKAYALAAKALEESHAANLTTWGKLFGLYYLGQTYKNLGDLTQAFEIFKEVLSFANECHYDLVKAMALSSLAALARTQKDFQVATSKHSESIAILERIVAIPELAEAYYQFGLTYQVMAEIEKSNSVYQQAIQLFTEMEAPKQVERVRQSMQGLK